MDFLGGVERHHPEEAEGNENKKTKKKAKDASQNEVVKREVA